RYSWKQPSAMCWPLSGGGAGSPSRSGSVCTAPPSVGRASYSATSWPASTSSSAAASPASPPPTTAAFSAPSAASPGREPRHGDAQLGQRRQARRAAEDVEARALDARQRRLVEVGEGGDAGRASPVQIGQERPTLLQVGARPRGLVGHERLPGWGAASGGDVRLGHAERGELVLRDVDAAEAPVLVDVAHDVDQLQGDAERLRPLRLVGPVDGDAGAAHGPGHAAAVAEQLVEAGVARLLGVLDAAVDQVVQGLRADWEAP